MGKNKTVLNLLGGFLVGAVNGIFGAGGGVLAVPLLKKAGLSEREAHACAIGVILPITLLSAALYLWRGDVALAEVLPFLPGGVIGSVVGAVFLKNITSKALRGIFGLVIIFAGVRMVFS